ncbi:2-hydroxyacyl-CoA dehydratase [Dyella sp. C9]|uniref:2-hydroxyacyl-CoA dehydratase n=1 Tax=Dyella sp. C9 TaxID=2202154 RepID=UPI000DEF93BA|nr:2-hydroxyacyl-CoA dehydratase [Dyella sp. C9]
MSVHKDAYRQFQDELAALDRDQERKRKASIESPMERARREFLELRERHGLSVADVIAFFPEEEGIAYLQSLIAAAESRPTTVRKRGAKRSEKGED